MARSCVAFFIVIVARALILPGAVLRAQQEEHRVGACPDNAGAIEMEIEPRDVDIDILYGGADVRVSALVPKGVEVAVLLEGEKGSLKLNKKGKVWGMLWMNVGEVEFGEVPSLYLLSTSGQLREVAEEVLEAAGLGYKALERRAGGESSAFRELLKLREQEGLFSLDEGAVRLRDAGDGMARLTVEYSLGPRVPPGGYEVRVMSLESTGARCLGSARVDLEAVGLAGILRSLAMNHGLLYGCVAVVVALLAGFTTGLIFGRGASKGH